MFARAASLADACSFGGGSLLGAGTLNAASRRAAIRSTRCATLNAWYSSGSSADSCVSMAAIAASRSAGSWATSLSSAGVACHVRATGVGWRRNGKRQHGSDGGKHPRERKPLPQQRTP